ncbi:hypothetical protein J5226_12625 [Lysobacter sp. K5869]|uniref:hypothetical protein n=1 Tax=Lysobacter sp. K5869 TaxID=2820808 RepID=UPI001C063DB9|nr:hypothetical protein [Lysobacter sp. K5869]QWP79174.1 hypothetical protein J5226_12625 [Lysobacter sp. K5869]
MKRDTTIRTAVLTALLLSGAALADDDGGGQGSSGTDRSNLAKSAPVVCRGEATAVAVPQADGSVVWICPAVEAQTPGG